LPDFRRSVHQVLERGKSVHALQRQICTQALPPKRGRRAEELIATSGALTLVTNCVMAWNTQRLQRAVDREAQRTAPRYCIDALKCIGPVGHRPINFRGTFRFPVDRYAERVVALHLALPMMYCSRDRDLLHERYATPLTYVMIPFLQPSPMA